MANFLILANNDVGLYKFRKELIQMLLDQGHKVYISLPRGIFIQPLIDMGCQFIDTAIERRGINPITDFKLLTQYFKMINQIKPDMVITYTIKPNIYGGIVCRIKKVPYAINVTGLGSALQNNGLLKRFISILYKLSCKKAKVVFFENVENRRSFVKNNIVNSKNACKLNGAGVNLVEYPFCEYPTDDKMHFLFIGRVMKEKGIDEFFAVAKLIKGEYDNVVFDIVGPLEDDYQDLITELKRRGYIEYHGFQSDVKPFIRKACCFILPSYHEGMANTLLECGAMGRPAITSDIYGCKEAIIDGETGYLVKVKDKKDLYKKIRQFVGLSENQKKAMGRAARAYIETVFDKKKVVAKTIEQLER